MHSNQMKIEYLFGFLHSVMTRKALFTSPFYFSLICYNRMSKHCQKIDIFLKKKKAKICHIFPKNCQWPFFEKYDNFWHFFDIQMANFRRVRWLLSDVRYLNLTTRDVKFAIQIMSDWPKMGQMWDFKRSLSVHFGSNVLKLTLKSSRFVPFKVLKSAKIKILELRKRSNAKIRRKIRTCC